MKSPFKRLAQQKYPPKWQRVDSQTPVRAPKMVPGRHQKNVVDHRPRHGHHSHRNNRFWHSVIPLPSHNMQLCIAGLLINCASQRWHKIIQNQRQNLTCNLVPNWL